KNSSALGEITRIVTGVSIIVTADSKENPGIGHVRLESPVTLGWNTQRPSGARSAARRGGIKDAQGCVLVRTRMERKRNPKQPG
ncbi:hypothetical protein, partial [Thiolapillus sp.]|uniref:hypothetical protein n=1 Tax=Thiolapillus sp. TaxID=2017437 RepID=UPI003AF61B6C